MSLVELKYHRDTSLEEYIFDWELEIKNTLGFVCLDQTNRRDFFAALEQVNEMDSYITSPVYHAFTGRKGLWAYQGKGGCVLLCWHPNVSGQILVFPPFGAHETDLLQECLNALPVPPSGIRLVRFKKEDVRKLLNSCQHSDSNISMKPVVEDVLDWKYPVRILSTKTVSELSGRHFSRIRDYIRQLKRQSITTKPLAQCDSEDILAFVYRWASKRTRCPHELENLVSPYRKLLALQQEFSDITEGLVFFVNGQMQGVSMWDIAFARTKIANAWISLCDTSIKGLSEFIMNTVSKKLFQKGVLYINCGGSETKGLDAYKSKYKPAFSIKLCSLDVQIKAQSFPVSIHPSYTERVAM